MSNSHSHKPKNPSPKLDDAEAQAPDGGERAYTLSSLVEHLGASTEEEVLVYVHGFDKAGLIREGARVGTSKIDTDAARMYGIAADFLAGQQKAAEGKGPAAEKAGARLDLLAAVDADMLRASVWAALQGSLANTALEAAGNVRSTSKETRIAAAETEHKTGMKRRNLLRTNLEALAGGNGAWLAKIAGATASTKTLDQQLADLAGVGRKMLGSKEAALQARVAKSRLSEGTFTAAENQAEKVKTTAEAAAGVSAAAEITQGDVDYWDGINLHLIGTFMDVFDAAHEVDPTIPRLLPNTLRGYFGRLRRAGTAAQEGASQDGTPAGQGAAEGAAKGPQNAAANTGGSK